MGEPRRDDQSARPPRSFVRRWKNQCHPAISGKSASAQTNVNGETAIPPGQRDSIVNPSQCAPKRNAAVDTNPTAISHIWRICWLTLSPDFQSTSAAATTIPTVAAHKAIPAPPQPESTAVTTIQPVMPNAEPTIPQP